ncbi:hypothetical protein EC957_012182 [Mortierella hygrophila]|uniref:Uncharacterized protein n=1 Tax=Mortierella hygrophila TaxID=979708 RepID=A0A9P6F8I6_9FUNG|nr:hypothetical protein EC957_012182 [Mortierella hygrophila]
MASSQYLDNDNNDFHPNMRIELGASSFSPFLSTPSSHYDLSSMISSSSSINSPAGWPEYNYPIELRRSCNSSSKYFKWVRPFARPGRHSSPDDDGDIDEDGTDDSFLEAEYPVLSTMDYSAPEYDSLFVGSYAPEQQQQQGFRSPKTKFFKWARPGRRHGGDDSDDDEERTDMDYEDDDDDETVMSNDEDEYFSDACSYTSAYPREAGAGTDYEEGISSGDDHSMSMMGPKRL